MRLGCLAHTMGRGWAGLWHVIVLAFAVSLDGLTAGITYGMRSIRVTPQAHAMIAAVSGVLMLGAMLLGSAAARVAPVALIQAVGASVLVMIGLWHILSARLKRPAAAREVQTTCNAPSTASSPRRLIRVRVSSLGVVVEILHDPIQADADRSGTIDIKEALVLGLALGLDAFGAGIAAAMLNISYWIVPVTAIACATLVRAGHLIGQAASQAHLRWVRWPWSAAPGLLLVVLGIARLRG